jgi:hypothetical protein
MTVADGNYRPMWSDRHDAVVCWWCAMHSPGTRPSWHLSDDWAVPTPDDLQPSNPAGDWPQGLERFINVIDYMNDPDNESLSSRECLVCSRQMTNLNSIKVGMGPVCAARSKGGA